VRRRHGAWGSRHNGTGAAVRSDLHEVVLQRDGDGVRPVCRTQLADDGLDVLIDGSLRNLKDLSRVLRGFSLGHPAQDLQLARRQRMIQRLRLDGVDELPVALSPGDGKLMRKRNFQDVGGPAGGQRVGAPD
jgi:hypothetical protein